MQLVLAVMVVNYLKISLTEANYITVHERQSLLGIPLAELHVHDVFECVMKCSRNVKCGSLNIEIVHPATAVQPLCQLFGEESEKFKEVNTGPRLVQNERFNHYAFQTNRRPTTTPSESSMKDTEIIKTTTSESDSKAVATTTAPQDDITITTTAALTAQSTSTEPLTTTSTGALTNPTTSALATTPAGVSCPPGWIVYQGHCYFMSTDALEYRDARLYCEGKSGTLILINDATENTYTETLANSETVWIGLKDLKNEGTFRWIGGVSITYTNWKDGQPDNLNNQDCVAMVTGGQWDDLSCSEEHKYICEK